MSNKYAKKHGKPPVGEKHERPVTILPQLLWVCLCSRGELIKQIPLSLGAEFPELKGGVAC